MMLRHSLVAIELPQVSQSFNASELNVPFLMMARQFDMTKALSLVQILSAAGSNCCGDCVDICSGIPAIPREEFPEMAVCSNVPAHPATEKAATVIAAKIVFFIS